MSRTPATYHFEIAASVLAAFGVSLSDNKLSQEFDVTGLVADGRIQLEKQSAQDDL